MTLALVLPSSVVGTAAPAPTPIAVSEVRVNARGAADGSHLVSAADGAGRMLDLDVYSAAMDSVITVKVLRAPDGSVPTPVLYLLNGANGGLDASSWFDQTDIADFFADTQISLVIPMGGRASYFTDWRTDDPVLGRQRWATFLTGELPVIIDSAIRGNGSNAIGGISMAATSVFQLALAAPGLYRAIGSYSGCARTSDPVGHAFVSAVVARWAGNAVNMWGPPGDPEWNATDPYLHADQLRGTAIYVSAGTGVPGALDTLDGPGIAGDTAKLQAQLTTGVVIEALSARCAVALRDRLAALRIPATFNLRPVGTHSWGYWQQDLHDSWPLFEHALH
ncbi:alpha/beta hydrolase [Nocardia sp. NPDC056000]|uniref:alpha/beta hydrolase n=1 Tax=Nocardia sp. NPDC056000 TaxID=3345674 RepID=UPI0035E0C6FC